MRCSAPDSIATSRTLATLIVAINGSGVPVSASTCRAASTAPAARSGAAVKADADGDVLSQEAGHLLLPGREHCGELVVARSVFRGGAREIGPKRWENGPDCGNCRGSARRAQVQPRSLPRGLGSRATTGATRLAHGGAAGRGRARDPRRRARGAAGPCGARHRGDAARGGGREVSRASRETHRARGVIGPAAGSGRGRGRRCWRSWLGRRGGSGRRRAHELCG